ncbi:MAG: TAXI family TRAP transporter solute-binding subunit [Chloroflexia bacterium]|nr:TAXI family TRAP transporter solute-binding subunit [Chloroflexia bacterium]
MRSFRSPRGLMVLVLMMVMALILAACGSTPAATPTEAPAPEATDAPVGETPTEAPAATPEPPPVSTERLRLSFGGGPVGGVFQVYADTLAIIVADADPNLEITAEGTGGSAENLRSTNSGDVEFGIVYAGDVALGAAGELPQDPTQYTNVLAMAPLYGGVIHLVVSERSGIQSVADLPGKRIALGNAGSGAALSAERYFTQMGLIDQIQVEYLGYSQAASAMGDGQLDGFWILAGFPNASVTEATTITSIRLIDVYNPGVEGGFFEAYPFYSARNLLGGAYTGVDEDVPSFQDTALWVANADVPDDVVYNALTTVFGDAGMSRLRAAHPSASEVALENGITGIGSRLHPGAVRFWEEQGVTIPDELK